RSRPASLLAPRDGRTSTFSAPAAAGSTGKARTGSASQHNSRESGPCRPPPPAPEAGGLKARRGPANGCSSAPPDRCAHADEEFLLELTVAHRQAAEVDLLALAH